MVVSSSWSLFLVVNVLVVFCGSCLFLMIHGNCFFWFVLQRSLSSTFMATKTHFDLARIGK